MFDARSDNMLDNAIQHPFVITDVEIHQKEALPQKCQKSQDFQTLEKQVRFMAWVKKLKISQVRLKHLL